jgi:hypothetical protein
MLRVMRIDVAQRRARLMRRHRLLPAARAQDPVEVAEDLVALHGTDPATVYLSLWARLREADRAAIDRALYDQRCLVRMLGMRRTMFVVPTDFAPVLQASCTRAIAAQQRKLLLGYLAQAGVDGDVAAWLRDVEAGAARGLAGRGSAYGAELVKDEPRLGLKLRLAAGKSYEATVNLTTRVLLLMGAEGRIVRGRPRGSWTSGQFLWHPVEEWFPGGLEELPAEAAQADLVRRWLRGFGPGTAADLRWWTGWTASDVSRALAAVGAVAVELESGAGFVLPDDLEPEGESEPAVALLPALDPTTMGWIGRDWYLGAHAPALFDRTGNAGPTLWWEGRVVGGWAQREDGEVVTRFLEDVGREAERQAAAEAERLGSWIGEVRIAPRARARPPLEAELTR